MNKTKEVIEDLWCNCGLDNPEPKYHNTNCTYRVGWEVLPKIGVDAPIKYRSSAN